MPSTYYDRYARTKGWKALKFLAGRGVQSAELNEMQSVLFDELHQLGKTVWSDGQVIRGIELHVSGLLASLTEGQVYFAGVFHDFPGGTVAVTGTGLEVIGLRFTSSIVTESEDPTLHDPASGWENSGYAGAHRLVYSLAVTNNAADAVPLFALQDGLLSADYRPQPAASDLALTLSRRTFDESGDYLVRGLRCRVEAKDANQFWVIVSDGKAYVRGSEFAFPAAVRLALDRPLGTGAIQSEPHTYLTGTNLYALSTPPVKAITSVSATVEKSVSITKGSANAADLMPYTPISSIESVTQGATTYVVGVDYQVNGNYISWALGGAEPVTGTTYSVTLRYIKPMVAITDYLLAGGDIDFSPAGDNPVHNTAFYVTYENYLPRHDLLVMTPRGELAIVQGTPSLFAAPPPAPADTLPIATFSMAANTAVESVSVLHSDRYRLTMSELQKLRSRVDDLEYNMAVTDLEQAAINVQLSTSKKAIFTDSFRDRSKMDTGHLQLSCAIGVAGDLLDTLYPNFVAAFHNLGTGLDRFETRDYTLTSFALQSYATHTICANPYSAFNSGGVLALDPPADIWVENVTVHTSTDQETITGVGTEVVWGWWEQWTDRSLVSETAIQATSLVKTVTVAGSGYLPYSDDLRVTLDGVLVPLFPGDGTLAGSIPESVRADSAGAFLATFDVPAGTFSGSHDIQIFNTLNSGSTEYLIDGRLNTWLEATTRVRHGRRRIQSSDPVAQTFEPPYDLFVGAVDLYFGAKSVANVPVVVSIRNVVNGYPGPDILAEKSLTPAEVSVSANGSVATQVVFPTPAYLRSTDEYCIVCGSNSNEYYLHYARLGGTDLLTGATVLANPAAGVMFSSANASTWTAHQSEDLKFRLYRAELGYTERVISFGTHTVDGSIITLMASAISPTGTSVAWEVQANGAGAWQSIPANTLVDMGVMLTSLSVRARLNGTPTLSPALFGAVGLVVAKWDASGAYVSRETTLSAYTSLRVYLDVSLPSGTSVTPYYSIDGGTNWVGCGAVVSETTVNPEFVERYYLVSGLSNPTQLRVKLALASSGDRLRVPRVRRLRAIAT